MADRDDAPRPDRVFELLSAFQTSALLKAAIDLDLFAAIDGGGATAAEIAGRVGASERGTRILCDALVVSELLAKRDGRYVATPTAAAFLDSRSPMAIGAAAGFLLSRPLLDGFFDLEAAVRKGGTVMPDEGTAAPESPIWVAFARLMAPVQRFAAQMVANVAGVDEAPRVRVLDVAAGHGLFGIAVAERNPRAEIVFQDWANVLEVALENAAAAGVADRVRTIPGDAFEVDLGGDYDLVLLPNFLHHFDAETNERLLRKVHGALAPGGRSITLEFIPDEDRTGPPMAVRFAAVMLVTTPRGDAYTFGELEAMFRRAGFSRSELQHLGPLPTRAVVSWK